MKSHIITPICSEYIDEKTVFHINPTGRFVIGGPPGTADSPARKIIVDTYGGYGRHGGGAFSGKDPSKVDRSAAYAARWVAKHVVKAGLAAKCEVQVAYAIGIAAPVSIRVDTFGTIKQAQGGKSLTDRSIEAAITKVFDLRPAAIIANSNFFVRSTKARRVRPHGARRSRSRVGADAEGGSASTSTFVNLWKAKMHRHSLKCGNCGESHIWISTWSQCIYGDCEPWPSRRS